MSARKKTLAIVASVSVAILAIGAAVAVPARMYHHRLERRVGLARTIWKEHAADFIDAL